MNKEFVVSTAEDSSTAERLYEFARSFVPRLRAVATQMERARRLDDAVMDAMEAAGLFSVLVSKRWGGAGLGPHEVNKVVEIIGSADCSAGWVTSFYNIHNWFLCRFPIETQQELFKNRPSVRTAAVFSPPGSSKRVKGGYRISGRWGYATGILHGSHALVPVMIGEAPQWVIVPRSELQVMDDWNMAAMAATGSVTIAAENVFVPDGWTYDITRLMSATEHGGTVHAEEVHHYPFTSLMMGPPSLAVGALDAAVELFREKLLTGKRMGVPMVDRPLARIRWANAYEAARLMRLLRDAATDDIVQLVRSGRTRSLEDEARMQMHLVTLFHGCKDALRLLVDGNGSSGYRADDPIRRSAGDVGVLATHALGADYDSTMDRHARWLLGLGLGPEDPVTRIA